MNNNQLYLAIGLPISVNLCTMTVVIVSALLSREQVNRICANVNGVSDRGNPEQVAIWNNFRERMAKLESRD